MTSFAPIPLPDDGLPLRDDYVALAPGESLWVFGYGSLMWDPGFPHTQAVRGRIFGYHRRFCILSHHYRGTPECPGLVLGLDRGGSCRGMAFEVAPEHARATLAYLWRREMVSEVYRPTVVSVHLPDGVVSACTFVADPKHEQYRHCHTLEETAALIRQGYGSRGANSEYLRYTVQHLDELGVGDTPLHQLVHLVGD